MSQKCEFLQLITLKIFLKILIHPYFLFMPAVIFIVAYKSITIVWLL